MPLRPLHGCHYCTCSLACLAPELVNSAPCLAGNSMSGQPGQGTHSEVNSEDVVARIGDAIRSYLAQATEDERQRCIEQIADWCTDRERSRREEQDSRVARVRRPLQFTLHSMPAHHLEPHHRVTPPQPTPSPIPTPIEQSIDMRHHL